MTQRPRVKNLIVLVLTAAIFVSSALGVSASADYVRPVEKVIIDNVLWPVEGIRIPRYVAKGTVIDTNGKTEAQIAAEQYNLSESIRLLDSETAYRIEDACWMYKEKTQGNESFVRVPETDTYFAAGYVYKLRVVLAANGTVFSVPKENILAYFDYATAVSKGRNDMSWFSTRTYSDENNEIDLDPARMRFDIEFNEEKEGENPFIELSRARAVDCTEYGKKDGKITGITDRMVVSGPTLREPVTGHSPKAETITGLGPGTYKVASVYEPDYYVNLTVGEPASQNATIKADAVDFGSVTCGFIPGEKDLVVTNTSDTDTYVTDMSFENGGEYFSSDFVSGSKVAVPAGESRTIAHITPSSSLRGENTFFGDIRVSYEQTPTSVVSTACRAKITVTHWYDYMQNGWCAGCDAYRADWTGRIVSGSGRTYYQNFWPQFKINIMFTHINSVLIDGAPISIGVQCGVTLDEYTVVTLQNDFIRTLVPGRHTITVVFKDQYGNIHQADGNFRISSATAAYTGDDTAMYRMGVVFLLSFSGIWMILFWSVKKKFQ